MICSILLNPGRGKAASSPRGSDYPTYPNLVGNGPILDLLRGGKIGVTLSDSHQMDPEYSTSALVDWHPQARYFSV